MTWPKTLDILGKKWKVSLVAKKQLAKDWPRVEPVGDFNSSSRTIRIWKDLPEDERWVTLLHEILHIAFSEAYREKKGARFEERLIENLDVFLYEILNVNFGFGP